MGVVIQRLLKQNSYLNIIFTVNTYLAHTIDVQENVSFSTNTGFFEATTPLSLHLSSSIGPDPIWKGIARRGYIKNEE